ncbi:MAG TPA: hypothetical protein HA263_00005 [Methanoregulaceae archaeon]|nr:hypothetical protein [Methanoregulaceae archaeon]
MAACVNVRIETGTKARLDSLKIHPRETYADVIDRLSRQAIDDEPLTPEDEADIAASLEDIRAGRVFTSDQVRRELGIR